MFKGISVCGNWVNGNNNLIIVNNNNMYVYPLHTYNLNVKSYNGIEAGLISW